MLHGFLKNIVFFRTSGVSRDGFVTFVTLVTFVTFVTLVTFVTIVTLVNRRGGYHPPAFTAERGVNLL